jgi:Chaperone of endosialidase
MSYTIKFSDLTTSTSITVPDMPPGINISDTSLNLVGRGYPNYGQKIAENFLHLLENFSSGSSPANPIQGQLWYDNVNNKLKVNTVRTGQGWSPVNGVWQQATDPSLSVSNNVLPGDLWVNTSIGNYVLNVRTADTLHPWVQVSNTSTGQTGSFSTQLQDNAGNSHWVVEHKSYGQVIAIDSYDQFYPNPVITNFNNQINTGTNMTTIGKFWGTAYSADALNLYPGSLTLRIPTERFLIKDDIAGGDIPGQGQLITGRVFFQNSDNNNGSNPPRGIVLTSPDDSYGTSKGLIQIYKSGNNLVLLNDRNPDFGYGNILLNTKLGRGSVKINSSAHAKSTVTGALTVIGGVGIGGDLYVGGDTYLTGTVHAGNFVAGSADNIFGGQAGYIPIQSNTGTTAFITTGSVGNLLQQQIGNTATFVSTATLRVGYSDHSNTLVGGNAGQVALQTATNQTVFVDQNTLVVGTSTDASNLLGPAGTIPLLTGTNRTSFIQTSSIMVGYSRTILGGSANQFLIQAGPDQTGFADPSVLAIKNILGGSRGGLIYQAAQDVSTTLSIGAPGQYLKVSAGALPEWVSPIGLPTNQVAIGQGTGFELIGDSGITYNPLTQVLTVSGDVIAGSDREIKENIQPITNALEKTLALQGVSFNYKKGGRPNLGLIAQEVQEIVPEVVSVNESTGFLGVGYGALVGLLVEAIKEQQAQIEELKRRIG